MLLNWGVGGEPSYVCVPEEACVPWTDEIKYTAVMKVDFPTAKAAAEIKIIHKRF